MTSPTVEVGDIEAIRQLKARYFRTMDQQDWDGYREVFTSDVIIDTTDDTGPGTQIIGREAYLDMLAVVLEGAITVHHGHMSEIEVDGDAAHGVWSMEDHIWFSEESGIATLWGTGWYEETYRRVDDEWKISHLVLRRQRVEMGGVQTFPH
ncbi:MAG: nuclear transport factor 2 family protein [Acidobacteria bacterium]|nr:nuclear transport factor 2 family protein [Acidobacteriota bacterium]